MVTIGQTPLLRLDRMQEPGAAEIYVKWEGANPTGSMKDRMALSMIEGAERRGLLKPGARVVDFTGGSTGSSLAMVCATKGYKAHFISSDAFSEEKLQTMRAFGATLEMIPSDNGRSSPQLVRNGLARAKELAAEPNTYWTDQFNNTDNRDGYASMANEVIEALGGSFDDFVMGVGTGGCFSGNATVYKEKVAGVRCIATEPEKSRVLSGLTPTGSHRMEGMGPGFVTSITRTDLIDEVIAVSDDEAFATARRLAREEGIFGGISSGGNVFAAMQRARKLGSGRRIVTVICDSGLKYLKGELFR
ncbi:MAG: cysteine synthase family protein [Vicinamibacteria bacterium]